MAILWVCRYIDRVDPKKGADSALRQHHIQCLAAEIGIQMVFEVEQESIDGRLEAPLDKIEELIEKIRNDGRYANDGFMMWGSKQEIPLIETRFERYKPVVGDFSDM